MQLALEIKNGPDAGRTLAIEAGQEVTIGRRTQADIVFTQDPYMSGLHLRIKWNGQRCFVEDLNSTAGTYVNLERIQMAELENGVRLRAGKTDFVVHLEEAQGSFGSVDPFSSIGFSAEGKKMLSQSGIDLAKAFEEEPESTDLGSAAKEPADLGSAVKEPAEFDVEECGSGLVALRGKKGKTGPGDVLSRLSKWRPAAVIIDPHKFAKRPFENPAKPVYLFNWMREGDLAQCSPIVLSAADGIDLGALVAKAWNENALIVVFTKLEKDERLKHLRAAARGDDAASDQPPKEGLLGYFWPKAARPFLTSAPARDVDALCSKVDAVLVESADPGGWEIYCKPDAAPALQKLLEAGT